MIANCCQQREQCSYWNRAGARLQSSFHLCLLIRNFQMSNFAQTHLVANDRMETSIAHLRWEGWAESEVRLSWKRAFVHPKMTDSTARKLRCQEIKYSNEENSYPHHPPVLAWPSKSWVQGWRLRVSTLISKGTIKNIWIFFFFCQGKKKSKSLFCADVFPKGYYFIFYEFVLQISSSMPPLIL